MALLLKGARVVTPGKDLGVTTLRLEDGLVAGIGADAGSAAADTVLDAEGLTALPGFVDIHTHGRSGYDYSDATDEAFDVMGRDRLTDGVTGFLATGLTLPEENLAEMCRCAARYAEKGDGATCLGVHLEGPFFNPACAGAQNPDYLKKPDIALVDRLNAIFPVRKVSLAPELEGSVEFIRALVSRGIVASGGHSSADYDCFRAAYAAGMTHGTHFCNVVTPLHHLRPGFVGGGLLAKDFFIEMICDGVHLSDPMIEILVRMKGADRTMVITDSIRAGGLSDGEFSLGGLPVVVAGGCARLKTDDGSVGAVAGSTSVYSACFRRYARVSGLPLEEAVKAAGYNQLRSLGIADRGEIAPGQVADIVLVDAELEPRKTIVSGRVAWESDAV